MHHAPALFLHPSRRLRALALSAHADILRVEQLRVQMLFYLREMASAEQVECILGSWCMATRDAERQVAQVAQRSWDAHISLDADLDTTTRAVEKEEKRLVLDGAQRAALLVFVQRALLDPLALHAYLNPVQVPVEVVVQRTIRGKPVPMPAVAAQTRRTDSELSARVKGENEEESETDRKARLRIGALGALQGILGMWTLCHLLWPLS
jgi:E3 ubiquitin-protein ligase listerin